MTDKLMINKEITRLEILTTSTFPPNVRAMAYASLRTLEWVKSNGTRDFLSPIEIIGKAMANPEEGIKERKRRRGPNKKTVKPRRGRPPLASYTTSTQETTQ